MLNEVNVLTKEHQFRPPTRELEIVIGPIRFPEYLNRPQIVTRTTGNELQLSEFDRWAGSLKEDFNRNLAENLSNLLKTDRIAIYPRRRLTKIDYQIELDIIRFDGILGQEVELKARWAIFRGESRTNYSVHMSNLKEATMGDDYDDLVTALSKTVRALSLEISQVISELPRQVPVD